jgi:hypothetical protein
VPLTILTGALAIMTAAPPLSRTAPPSRPPWRDYRVILLILGAGLAFGVPLNIDTDASWTSATSANVWSFYRFISALQPFIPFIAALLILQWLDDRAHTTSITAREQDLSHPRNRLRIAALMFSALLVSTQITLFSLPIPFLLSILLFHRWGVVPRSQLVSVARHRLDVIRNRTDWLARTQWSEQLGRRARNVTQQVETGSIAISEFRAELEQIEKERTGLATKFRLSESGFRPVFLGAGIHASSWEDGLAALQFGKLFVFPMLPKERSGNLNSISPLELVRFDHGNVIADALFKGVFGPVS